MNLKILLFLLIFSNLYSDNTNNTNIYSSFDKVIYNSNDIIILTINVTTFSKNVVFQELELLSNNKIIETKFYMKNNYSNPYLNQYIKKYIFKARESSIIEPIFIMIDDEKYFTKNISLIVNTFNEEKKPEINNIISFKNSVKSSIKPINKNIYLGQAIKFTTKFTIFNDGNIEKLELIPWKQNDFWSKQPKDIIINKESKLEQRMTKWIIPQKKGRLLIPKLGLKITKIFKNGELKINKIYTNKFEYFVKPLPDNIILFGDFKIESFITNKKFEQNKPIKLKIKIKSINSNHDDIEDFNLKIKDCMVFKKKNENFENIKEKYFENINIQNFDIICNKNFTIPSFKLNFMNNKTLKINNIKSKSIDINITFNKTNNINLITNNKVNNSTDEDDFNKVFIFIFFILSIFMISLISFLYLKKVEKKRIKNKYELIYRIKNDKELLTHLLLEFKHLDKNKNYINLLKLINLKLVNKKVLNRKEIFDFIIKIEDDENINSIIF